MTTIQWKTWQQTLSSNLVMAFTMNDSVPWNLRCRIILCHRAPYPRLAFFWQTLGKDLCRKAAHRLVLPPILFHFSFPAGSPCPTLSLTILPFTQCVHFIFLLLESLPLPLSISTLCSSPPRPHPKGHLNFFLSEISNYLPAIILSWVYPHRITSPWSRVSCQMCTAELNQLGSETR